MDIIKNFAYGIVLTPPDPPTTGETLVLINGQGAEFPDPEIDGEFNIIIKPFREVPTSDNAEIVRVTEKEDDTLTIVREQEGSSARTIIATDEVYLAVTKKTIDDAVHKAGAQTITGVKTFSATPKTDAVAEKTADAGVTVDGLLIKDGTPASWDGWIIANETWTYASATTFTVSGDVRTKYPKGTKIKLTQTTVKYFYVVATSYSAPNTTITVTGGADYTLADAVISANFYSYSDTPQGFPQWFNHTPVFTGFSVNPSSPVCRFCIVGTTCYFIFSTYGAGTSNAATFTISLPVPSVTKTNITFGFPIAVYDNTAWQAAAGVAIITSAATVVGLGKTCVGVGGFTTSGNKGANVALFYEI